MSESKTQDGGILSPDEVHRLGQQWFEEKIQPLVADRNTWECVSIDVLTGEYETAAEPLEAADRLRARQPLAVIWTRRVGFPYVHRFGFAPRNRPVELRRVPT